MIVSLVTAVWGFWQGRVVHRNSSPLITGIIGALLLSLGVIVVHGPPAMAMIYSGAALLIVATVVNIWMKARRV
jgi:hypothetical protein